jgi:hypothetical protein
MTRVAIQGIPRTVSWRERNAEYSVMLKKLHGEIDMTLLADPQNGDREMNWLMAALKSSVNLTLDTEVALQIVEIPLAERAKRARNPTTRQFNYALEHQRDVQYFAIGARDPAVAIAKLSEVAAESGYQKNTVIIADGTQHYFRNTFKNQRAIKYTFEIQTPEVVNFVNANLASEVTPYATWNTGVQELDIFVSPSLKAIAEDNQDTSMQTLRREQVLCEYIELPTQRPQELEKLDARNTAVMILGQSKHDAAWRRFDLARCLEESNGGWMFDPKSRNPQGFSDDFVLFIEKQNLGLSQEKLRSIHLHLNENGESYDQVPDAAYINRADTLRDVGNWRDIFPFMRIDDENGKFEVSAPRTLSDLMEGVLPSDYLHEQAKLILRATDGDEAKRKAVLRNLFGDACAQQYENIAQPRVLAMNAESGLRQGGGQAQAQPQKPPQNTAQPVVISSGPAGLSLPSAPKASDRFEAVMTNETAQLFHAEFAPFFSQFSTDFPEQARALESTLVTRLDKTHGTSVQASYFKSVVEVLKTNSILKAGKFDFAASQYNAGLGEQISAKMPIMQEMINATPLPKEQLSISLAAKARLSIGASGSLSGGVLSAGASFAAPGNLKGRIIDAFKDNKTKTDADLGKLHSVRLAWLNKKIYYLDEHELSIMLCLLNMEFTLDNLIKLAKHGLAPMSGIIWRPWEHYIMHSVVVMRAGREVSFDCENPSNLPRRASRP